MVAQVRRAVAWVARHAAERGGDPARLYLGGHSSGAHLAGNVLVTDWTKEFERPADLVKGALCVSGMYELRPVRLSARSSYVRFDDRIEHELSPMRHLERLACPVTVVWDLRLVTIRTPGDNRQRVTDGFEERCDGSPSRQARGG